MKDQQFEALLAQALRPEIEAEAIALRDRGIRKGKSMYMKTTIKRACMAAAIIAILTTTVSAAGALNIKTLTSGRTSKRYDTVQEAEEKAGFQMDDLTQFSNGYGFGGARVGETKALDDKDQVKLTYNEINVELENDTGERILLIAHEYHEGIVDSDVPPDQVRQLDGITMKYRLHHYKFVPGDYVQTESDKVWLQQPGNFMSYGSETGIRESEVAFLNWEKEGICYTLMDSGGSEPADSLFAMAGELILSGK